MGQTQAGQYPSGKTWVYIPVWSKTLVPTTTREYDQKEREQRVSVLQAATRAHGEVQKLARGGFTGPASAKTAVETLTRRILINENRKQILQTDVTNQW